MIATYQRISRADGDLGKDGKDKSNSIENQKELIQRYISHKESLQNLPVMDFVDDGYTGSNFDRPGFQKMMDGVRSGEIDLIARDGDTIVFIEVKARPAGKLGAGVAAVTADKRRRLRHAADAYLSRKRLRDAPCRFDILEFSRAGIFYMENAF